MSENKNNWNKMVAALLVAAAVIMVFNAYQLSSALSTLKVGSIPAQATKSAAAAPAAVAPVNAANLPDILPKGVPALYGQELGVSFDDVSADNPSLADQTITKLGNLDRQIQLSGTDLERYISILYKKENGIACEYCCGARSVIFENGQAACGCAHSYAMRGLAKYLLTKYGSEYTDSQILEEVGKWKTLFFPSILQTKAAVLQSKGIELNYINLASNKYRDIEKGQQSGGNMVGGC